MSNFSNLWVQETFVNESAGHRYGDTEPYESFTDDLGTLYKSLRREYGSCTGRMYRDVESGAMQVGWVFRKRVQYDDSRETYLREVWVEVYAAEPVKSVTWERKYPAKFLGGAK